MTSEYFFNHSITNIFIIIIYQHNVQRPIKNKCGWSFSLELKDYDSSDSSSTSQTQIMLKNCVIPFSNLVSRQHVGKLKAGVADIAHVSRGVGVNVSHVSLEEKPGRESIFAKWTFFRSQKRLFFIGVSSPEIFSHFIYLYPKSEVGVRQHQEREEKRNLFKGC